MQATIENGELVVRLAINQPHVESKSGKTMSLASSHGNQKVDIDGVQHWIGLNCYTYQKLLDEAQAKPKGKAKKPLSAKAKAQIKSHNDEVTASMKK